MHSRKPSAFLSKPDGIASLLPQAQLLIELRRRLAVVLPEALKSTCSVANYKQGKVVIFATNGAVAAKLKLISHRLAEQLSGRLQVTGIEIHVQPLEPRTQPPVRSKESLKNGTDALLRLQQQLPDSQLKDAVGRLLLTKRQNPQNPQSK